MCSCIVITFVRSGKNCVYIWRGYLLIWRRIGFRRTMGHQKINCEKVGQYS